MKSVSGSLASHDLLTSAAAAGHGRSTRALFARARACLGPTSPARLIFDALLLPLLADGGLAITLAHTDSVMVTASFGLPGFAPAGVASAAPWGADLRRLRDRTARQGLRGRWWIGVNGTTLRIMDVSRAYTRRAIDLDLTRLEDEDQALALLPALLACTADGMPALEDLVARSASHRVSVGHSLPAGVEDALNTLVSGFDRGGRRRVEASFGDALTVIYRILFLLFAEAR